MSDAAFSFAADTEHTNLRNDDHENESTQAGIEEESTLSTTLVNSDIDLKLQAQEFMYRHTLVREQHKVNPHSLEEVGRSLNAISQRRRQYFLDYKTCTSIRQVRQWFVWETKRNLDTNHTEMKTENAATRGLKVFLNKIEFYSTLLARFGEYVVSPLQKHYSVLHDGNFEVGHIRDKMMALQEECDTLMSDNNEVVLRSHNHSEVEIKFPVISVLPRVHEALGKLVDLATQWRLHARYGQMFEQILYKRAKMESISQLDEKKQTLREIEHHLRSMRFEIKELEAELQQRQNAMASRDFSDIYTECSASLEELEDHSEKKKKEIRSIETTIKYIHEKTEAYKKIVQHKRKQKLEANMKKKEERVKELKTILSEIERLEKHKDSMDRDEEAWLRGGYERELGVIQDIKDKLNKIKHNVADLESERDILRKSYHDTREKVMTLDGEHESLTHEYEYVKRLSTAVIASLWNVNVFSQIKISLSDMRENSAYNMRQPKGVALIVSNDEPKINLISSGVVPFSRSEGSVFKGRLPTDVSTRKPNATIDCFSAAFTQLGYYVINRQKLSTDALRKNLTGMSDKYHEFTCDLNSLVVLVVAQADEHGKVLSGDGDHTSSTAIPGFIEHFTNARCPSLMGKPKIFIFLLRVTEHDPKIPVVGKKGGVKRRGNTTKEKRMDSEDDVFYRSSEASTPVRQSHFHPDPMNLSQFGDDIIVVRVLHQLETNGDATPTFGGTSNLHTEKVSWHTQILLGAIMKESGSKDILSILEDVKEEVYQVEKSGNISRMPTQKEVVEFFVDHTLKKKLYLMPGL